MLVQFRLPLTFRVEGDLTATRMYTKECQADVQETVEQDITV